jgi:PIN domain nuclease of toxin-antitoxin system
MLTCIIDTHTVIWYLDNDQRLSRKAREFIEMTAAHGDQVGLSTISLVEIIYLIEKAKIPSDTLVRLRMAINEPDSVIVETPLDMDTVQSVLQINRLQVPDMPDRIIAATALHHNVPLVSRDGRIQASGIQTIW